MIVQRLRGIQNRFGYLPDDELRKLAAETGLPLYKLEEVASFFPAFRQERDKPPFVEVKVCRDMTCHHRGAAALLAPDGLHALAAELSAACGRSVAVSGVSCLGRCDRAPAVWVERHDHAHDTAADDPHEHGWVYAGRDRATLGGVLRDIAVGMKRPDPDTDATYPVNTNVDRDAAGAPLWEINVYGPPDAPARYDAVRQFVRWVDEKRDGHFPTPPLRNLGGNDLSRYVADVHPFLWQMYRSGLLGMGGAGMATYQKWLDVWREPGTEKYVVCNGDESEPGTFKDRELLLHFPNLVVEGVILAGLITNATAGYIYVRHEYHEQIAACRAAVAEAEELGACGPDVFGSGRSFPVEVFESPGGYICGEQSALIEAMEDRRSQPRNRPPELTTNGLRDKPTVVNNVETLAWAPYIILRGGTTYAGGGWRVAGEELGFGGRRLFSVSGDVNRPGVYEVPVGLPLGELVNGREYCSGITGGRGVGFVAASGPSGGLLPAKLPVDPKARDGFARGVARIRERSEPDAAFMQWFLDTHLPPGTTELDLLAVPLDLGFFRNLNAVLRLPVEAMLGAGIGVYAAGSDALDHAVNYSQFYRNESCGKCVPCRIGSEKIARIGLGLLDRSRAGGVSATELTAVRADVLEMAKTMQQTSICGLGYVAPIPLSTGADVLRRRYHEKGGATDEHG